MKTSKSFDHKAVEKKWQEKWLQEKLYITSEDMSSKKRYVLDMFPYPSGATMHVGHLEGYIGTDILCRFLRMNGYSVLHPMGWDAFGLPAENYAIKTGIHPDISTHKNIETFKRQLESAGLSYDWTKEIDTSDPDFYRWTQWLFILMFKAGLAYKKKAPVNWCPKDETVLANEQVVDGKCERCGTEVVQKELEQWFLKITDYADRLISGLDKIDWLPEVKVQQKNWIGKSKGMLIKFQIANTKHQIETFTTRADTLNAATFIAQAPEEKKEKIKGDKEKEGKFTGKYAINPLNGRKLPIWEANYVSKDYGTGIIMGVPAHDERDLEFANKYKLDIIDLEPDQNLFKIIEDNGWGTDHTNYHLRDWLISRQRYWGCPIPMIYCKEDGWQPVPESDLPVLLPKDVDFLPHGESPIARSKTFQKGVKCPKCGKEAKREVDTMDTYVDSSWYFMRFVDPNNKTSFAGQEKIKKWLPVDDYVGGGHVVQHLLFARFFWKVLFDQGLIDKSLGDEPFLKLRAPGWILGPDSRKMSKRWNNVITPDDIIPKFGADVLRLYEMFMGPFDIVKPWSISGVEGMRRFVDRVWRFFTENKDLVLLSEKDSKELLITIHQTIKKVTKDIEEYRYNTAIASMMEFVNLLHDKAKNTKKAGKMRCAEWDQALKTLAQLLAPFAPHLAEEVWVNVLGQKFSVHTSKWPVYDPDYLKVDQVTIIIQINGKVRSQLTANSQLSTVKSEIEKLAKSDPKIVKWVNGGIKDVIFIPGKVINFVTKV